MRQVNTTVESTLGKSAGNKRLISTLFKCVVSGMLIFWVLHDTNLQEIFVALRPAKSSFLLLAFLLSLFNIYVSAHRWRILLDAKGINAPIPFLFLSIMVGMFFNSFLPSIVGGDVARVYDSCRLGLQKTHATVVVLMDRLLGILALLLFSFIALLHSTEITSNLSFRNQWIILTGGMVILVAWIIFLPPRNALRSIGDIRVPFSRKLQNIIAKIFNTSLGFQGHEGRLVLGLGMSLILQAGVIMHYFFLAKALGLHVPLYDYFLFIPISILIMMMPISINAIGIRENVFVFFFSILGVAKAECIAFAWLSFAFVILRGILGGIVYVFRKGP